MMKEIILIGFLLLSVLLVSGYTINTNEEELNFTLSNDYTINTNAIDLNFTLAEAEEGAVSTCECSSIQAGNPVDCTEECDISACDALGQDIIMRGMGGITMSGDITNYGNVAVSGGCKVGGSGTFK